MQYSITSFFLFPQILLLFAKINWENLGKSFFFPSVNLTISGIFLGKIHQIFNITKLTKKHPALRPPESTWMLD
jgi:hypothetical protein